MKQTNILQNNLLHAIWSDDPGVRFISTLNNNGAWSDNPFRSTDAALQFASQSAKDGLNVFYSLGLFSKETRQKPYVTGLSALVLDVDVDAGPSKPYPNQSEANLALSAFVREMDLPEPVRVFSGNGVHSYWIFPKSIDPTEWAELAGALRGACAAQGLKADNKVTGNFAGVLRLPGSQNHKSKLPKEVSLTTDVHLTEFATINKALAPYIKRRKPNVELANAPFRVDYPERPKDANLIADQCQQVGEMRESRGNLPEPNWYASLGVLALCEDGELIAHEWSRGYPNYSHDETNRKFERAKDFAPTTCDHFAEVSPEICANCPHQGIITTPLQLGDIRTDQGTSSIEKPAPTSEWPDAPTSTSAAFHGLAGEIVRAIEPHSEADPIALLVQILVGFGSVIGRRAHFLAEADSHYTNIFAVLVGATSKGRKGTSWGYIRRLFEAVDADWSSQRIKSGLSSGEGLIWAVRDPIAKREQIKVKGKVTDDYQVVITDEGVADKRLLAMEPEIAGLLRVTARDGNTVSATIRQAWDTGNLQTLTKNSPAISTGAHISIIGHITKDELRRYLDSTESANGFANRFLWTCVQRSKVLPEGGQLLTVDFDSMIQRLRDAVSAAKNRSVILTRDQEARSLWFDVYEDLSEGKPGLLGAVTGRSEAQVMRLACLYALLDQSQAIQRAHLEAALALWKYCEDSARHIFGDALGEPNADAILLALIEASESGLTRTDINNLFKGNVKANTINHALKSLATAGLAISESASTGRAGRPTVTWFSTRVRNKN